MTKHSATDAARVWSSWDAEHLTITITDDGRESDPATEHRPGYGVLGMQERMIAVGGELTARRRPEGGFVVTARMPLTRVHAAASPNSSELALP